MRSYSLFALLLAAVAFIPSSFAQSLENIDTVYPQDKGFIDSPALSVQNGRESIGLVLSGGGAKGIAHVGVIKALEDNDIPIDYVTGTSMGAVVGSLYSCGWSPERMMELFKSKEFLDWSRGVISPENTNYFDKPDKTPAWVSVNLSFKKDKPITSEILPTSLISPIPMNIEFLRIFAPYTEQCGENFNDLFVPFRSVASDIYHKHKVVFSNGSLGDAVRASMSFPLVFRPIEVDSILLYDGGIYDNFPVDVMEKEFNPDFIIGVSVSGPNTKPVEGNMMSQLEDMISQKSDYNVPSEKGVKIQCPVLSFGVLDFDKADIIYEIGYKTGLAMVDSIKSRIRSEVPLSSVNQRRQTYASQTPDVLFDKVTVKGLDKNEAGYLEYLFTGGKPGAIDLPQTVKAYYRAVDDGSLSNLVPQAKFSQNGENTLELFATPKHPWRFGLGGYVTTSTNSMLYFSGSYHTMGYNSLDVSFGAWLGQSYFAGMVKAKFSMRTNTPSYVELTGVLSKQKYYEKEELFFKTSNPMFTTEVDNFVKAGYTWQMGRTAKGYASLAGGYVSDSFYDTDGSDGNEGRNIMQYWAAVLSAGVEKNTLDHELYPTQGMQSFANADISYQWSRFLAPEGYVDPAGWKKTPVVSLNILWKQFYKVTDNFRFGAMANVYATLQHLNQNYTNTLVHAKAFAPTPSTQNYFNLAFRSDNYGAIGIIPVWKPTGGLQVRGDFYGFVPIRNLAKTDYLQTARYQGWFKNPQFIGEVSVIYSLPFANISVYGNYLSSPARNWNFGISLGLYFRAPKLLGR